MKQLLTKEQNPTGLHAKYLIQKYAGKEFVGNDFFGNPVYEPTFEDVEPNAEYFVLRLDINGDDIEHIKACRIAINSYADAIQNHIPDLARDIREKYSIIND